MLTRCQVEQAAIEKEGDDTERRRLADAFTAALVDRGVVTAAELRGEVEVLDSRGTKAEGPRLVARAWTDPDFKVFARIDTT